MVNKYVTNFSHRTLFPAVFLNVLPPLWNLNYYLFLRLGNVVNRCLMNQWCDLFCEVPGGPNFCIRFQHGNRPKNTIDHLILTSFQGPAKKTELGF